MNDISYWSMLPSLSKDQKEREKIGSNARIYANIGLFTIVAGIVPITEMLGNRLGNMQKGYFALAVIIVCMMLMFLTDSVEYGEWKFRKRNDSVTLSLQPFINKMGGAVASGITGAVVIISGMQEARTAADMTPEGLLILKIAMMILPPICIVVGFIVYRAKYILNEEMYAKIVRKIEERKQK